MHLPFQSLLAVIALLLVPFTASGAAFIPKDDAIIASSNSALDASVSIDEISTLLANSQYAGQTERLQGVLKTHLATLYQQQPTSQVGYMYARVLQKEHLFEQAIAIAQKVLAADPNHVNSHLLLANIFMTQGKFSPAKQHCTATIGLVSIITASTCLLDVQSQHQDLAQSYQSLLTIINNKETSLATDHVLSEMSYRLGHYQQAFAHIKQVNLATAPVSLIVLWADIQLKLNNNQRVLYSLSKLVDDDSNLEDALLLRLAMAEKNLNVASQPWQKIMAARVSLRELRQDTFHASDLANYYIRIKPNRDKALYWANINWQQAKMSLDQQLLNAAQTMPRGEQR